MQLNPYLFFNGKCEAAFRFYEKALGGKIVAMMTHEEAPADCQFAPEMLKKIIHARLMVGDKVLMGSDAPADRYDPAKGFTVTLGVDTPAEAERIFADLAQDGTIHMPMAETFFARKFGMLADQFGIPWMVICEKKPS
jgi:PhnB protein